VVVRGEGAQLGEVVNMTPAAAPRMKDLKNTQWYSNQSTSISSTNASKTIDINN
jgi:hypothetical protein